jgi:hypothetical protein
MWKTILTNDLHRLEQRASITSFPPGPSLVVYLMCLSSSFKPFFARSFPKVRQFTSRTMLLDVTLPRIFP